MVKTYLFVVEHFYLRTFSSVNINQIALKLASAVTFAHYYAIAQIAKIFDYIIIM